MFGAVSTDSESAGSLVRALLGSGRGWLDLSPIDSGDPLVDELQRAAREAGARAISRRVLRSPYVELRGDWDGFQAQLPSRLRTNTARRWRNLSREGTLEVVFADGRDRLDELLGEGFAVEGSGWKDEAGTAIASQPRTERFYRDVASWAAGRGWLRLAFMRLDGRCIAFDFSIAQGGSLYSLKGGFDPAYRRFAPGTLLMREAIARAFAERLATFEFLGADDPHKLAWSETVRERVRLQAFPATVVGRAGLATLAYARPLAKRVRRWAARPRGRA